MAACIYNLLVSIAFGDQLNKTLHLLNNLEQEGHVLHIQKQQDWVNVYRVDNVFIDIYNGNVSSIHKQKINAIEAADCLIKDLHKEQAQTKRKWEQAAKHLVPQTNADNVAYFPVQLGNSKMAKILVDNKVWKKLTAASAIPFAVGQFGQVWINIHGQQQQLSHYLHALPANMVVDHIHGNVFNHRLDH